MTKGKGFVPAAAVVFAALVFMASPAHPAPQDGGATIREQSLVIPTYRVEAPDPNPRFFAGRAYQGAAGKVYPYPMYDRLTTVREDRAFRAVVLENEYLEVSVLPEIGGRIFYARDKTNGYDLFYRQGVIKPALIGMLGAWIAGGVEWNVPHHHRATSFLPVDHTLKENPDGSVTLWIGETELRHRMRWILGITLRPGRSRIEVTGRIFNRTPFAHAFLYWANAAVHTHDDYQVIFPPDVVYATYHGKNQFVHWPIARKTYHGQDYSDGVDVSWWKRHPSATSMFAWESKGRFLAGYDHGKNAGVVHVADPAVMPGKKFWTWGTGSRGRMWEKIYTDEDGPYLELMVGAYSDNQPDYGWIKPYEVKTFDQCWFPLREMGGVKAANREAAADLALTGDGKVKIAVNVTARREEARVVLTAIDRVLIDRSVLISPANPFRDEADVPDGVEETDLELALYTRAGEGLITYRPVKKGDDPMPEAVKPPPAPEEMKTVEELYLAGLRLEQFHHPTLEPYPYYVEALGRDPGDVRVNTALGLLFLKRGMFKEAEEKLRRAVKRIRGNHTRPKDGEALYYLGVVLQALGKDEAARDAFHRAAWDQAFHGAAHYQLAELACGAGDFWGALKHLDHAVAANGWNTKARALRATVLRRLGRTEEGAAAAGAVLALDPLDLWGAHERSLARGGTEPRLETGVAYLLANDGGRYAAQPYLELAWDYGRCGLLDEAVEVLQSVFKFTSRRAGVHPMVCYTLAFFSEQRGEVEVAAEYYRLGSSMSPKHAFPFRLESIRVLEGAAGADGSDPLPHYYLGNLLYDHQPAQAVRAWERSRELDETLALVHRNLGLAYARTEGNVSKAAASLEKASVCDPHDPRLYYELDLLSEQDGSDPGERLARLEANLETVRKRDDALTRAVVLQVRMGKYDEAIENLENHHFHLWEGGGRIHQVFMNAYLLRGLDHFERERYAEALMDYQKALAYPENLEVGKPEQAPWEARAHYFIATALEGLGRKTEATASFGKASTVEQGPEGSVYRYYQGLALKKLGGEGEAEKIFTAMIEHGEARLESEEAVDFFAKFGERQARQHQQADAYYLIGLGRLGKGDTAGAKEAFEKALALNPDHLWAGVELRHLGG